MVEYRPCGAFHRQLWGFVCASFSILYSNKSCRYVSQVSCASGHANPINSGLGRAASHASSAWGNWFCPLAKIGSSLPLAHRFQILWAIFPFYLIDVTYAFPWNLVLSSHHRQKWAKRFLWRTLTHNSNTDN